MQRLQLPPLAIATDALRLTIGNLGQYLRLAAVPFAVSSAVLLWGEYRSDAPVVVLVAALVAMLAMVPVATAWHRFLVLSVGLDTRWLHLRFGRREGSYLLVTAKLAGVALLLMLPITIMLLLMTQAPGGREIAAVVVAGSIAVAALAPVPFLLALPASAVGDPAGLFEAWDLSRGNLPTLAWVQSGLVAASFVASLPLAVLPGAIGVVYGQAAGFLIMAWWVAALSLVYLRLRPPEMTAPEPY